MTATRLLVIVACLAACKERGTISVDLTFTCPMSETATQVRFQVVKNGSCEACACGECPCNNSNDSGQKCVVEIDCLSPFCPIADVHMNGIDFDPPESGHYALSYHFIDTSGQEVGVLCAEVDIAADGTKSTVIDDPAQDCCQ